MGGAACRRSGTGVQPQGFQHYAEAFADAEHEAAGAGARLAAQASDRSNPAIARSSALEALTRYPTPASVDAARGSLADPDALARRASISTLEMLPPAERLPLIAPLLGDPVRTVRLEAAAALADALTDASAAQRSDFDRAAAEYVSTQRFNADRPESRAALGSFYARQGRMEDAEAQFRAALALDPAFTAAYVNLADLWRAQGRDADAERMLREGLRRVPAAGALHYSLGLTLVRLGHRSEAFARAPACGTPCAERCPLRLRLCGESACRRQDPRQPSPRSIARCSIHPLIVIFLIAAVTFRRDGGDVSGARPYALRLSQRYPDDSDAAKLLIELGGE